MLRGSSSLAAAAAAAATRSSSRSSHSAAAAAIIAASSLSASTASSSSSSAFAAATAAAAAASARASAATHSPRRDSSSSSPSSSSSSLPRWLAPDRPAPPRPSVETVGSGNGSSSGSSNGSGSHHHHYAAPWHAPGVVARRPWLGGEVSEAVPAALGSLGTAVLDDASLRERLPEDVWARFAAARTTQDRVGWAEANAVAAAVRGWAQARGVATYAHWFSPVRGCGAGEKVETFVDVDFKSGRLLTGLSGTELFQSETDGSSFPNGGLRATHTAAAYMGWDTTAAPFIRGGTLYIPSVFVAWTGDALDYRTPLLRSHTAVSSASVRVLRHLGDTETSNVVSNVGWEQEFFLVDRELYLKRPDLVNTGRSLFGKMPNRGQELSNNYFGRMTPRVRAVLDTARERLWELGVSINCVHNEVAPGQHEFCPIFSLSHLAADSNVLAMEVLRDACFEQGLAVLYHEKPFAGINGTGKHCNWGLNTDTGGNVFVPGTTELEQRRFTTFVAALARTIHLHGDLMRASVSTSGNDHRLGAQEAPPAILTLGLGQELEAFMRRTAEGGPLTGYGLTGTGGAKGMSSSREISVVPSVRAIAGALEDRNRTAPFPWCGNRFEFRAVGGAQQIAWPMAVLNAAIADSLDHMADQADANGGDIDAVVRDTLKAHQGALFCGDGYDAPLIEATAKREGLAHLKTSPEAYNQLAAEKNVRVLSSIFTPREVSARRTLLNETFATELDIEARTALDMIRTGVLPAVVADIKAEAEASLPENPSLERKRALARDLILAADALEETVNATPDGVELVTSALTADYDTQDAADAQAAAHHAQEKVRPALARAREVVDTLEGLTDAKRWPYPPIADLVHSHQ